MIMSVVEGAEIASFEHLASLILPCHSGSQAKHWNRMTQQLSNLPKEEKK